MSQQQLKVVWQFGSSNPENGENLATIGQWWARLAGKEINWRQRLVPQSGDVSELDWDLQRFDETFIMTTPELRGTTLYWRKPDVKDERNITVQKLELDTLRQRLYAFPQSQQEVVIRVALPEVNYQTLELKHPQVQLLQSGTEYVLSFRDESRLVEVKVTLNAIQLNQLKQQMP